MLVYFIALCSIVRRHHRDVRRMMDARRKMAAMAARSDAALTNMSQGLTLFDPDGRLRVASVRFREMVGLSRDAAPIGISAPLLARELPARGLPDAEAWALPTGHPHGRAVLDLPDGRFVALCQEALPDGGWMTTYEDVTGGAGPNPASATWPGTTR
ncbi:PAS-domain containing protein [Roseomonas sp. GCM10028921]